MQGQGRATGCPKIKWPYQNDECRRLAAIEVIVVTAHTFTSCKHHHARVMGAILRSPCGMPALIAL
jgi:hypothetical protein